MNYEEFKKRDPALANAVAELIGQYSPEYYRGFIRAINIIQKDEDIGIHRLEEYKAYCKFKLEGEDVPITALMNRPLREPVIDFERMLQVEPKKRGRPRKHEY